MIALTQTRLALRDWLSILGTAYVAARKERARWGSF